MEASIAISCIEKSDVIRFINWYPENTQPEYKTHKPLTNMTINLSEDSENELAELAREFKQKVLSFYRNKLENGS